MHGLQ